MKVVAAYLLAALGGKEAPAAADVKAILKSVGVEADDTEVNKVIDELKGKSVADVIAAGSTKLATMPAGGAAKAAAPAASAAPAAGAKEEKKEEKKKEEKKEESDEDMGFGLFD